MSVTYRPGPNYIEPALFMRINIFNHLNYDLQPVKVVTGVSFCCGQAHARVHTADNEWVDLCIKPIHQRFTAMNKQLTTMLLSLSVFIAVPAPAVDTGAVLGGAIGGGVGAAVGSEVGGREGAIIGGALGGGVGAAIGTHDNGHEKEKTVIYVERPRQDGPPGHAYGHRIPPGHAKHKHKRKHH